MQKLIISAFKATQFISIFIIFTSKIRIIESDILSKSRSMERKEFIKTILAFSAMGTLSSFKLFTDNLPTQNKKMPVLFTSHGNPMDIPVSREERAFWKTLYGLGQELQNNYEVKAALVVSAHWCTRGTYVNISPEQKQIYDYYGFPDEYYKVEYHAKGAPDIAHEVKKSFLLFLKQAIGDWITEPGLC